MYLHLTLVALIVAFFAIVPGRRYGHLSPVSMFVYVQAVMAVGIFPVLDERFSADVTHAALIVSAIAAVVMVATFCSLFLSRVGRGDFRPEVEWGFPRQSVWFLVILSVAISGLYYYSIGYLAFFEAIQSIVSGAGEDVAGLRLESYAGSRYLFPGYVNQFKNALLPALSLVIIASAFQGRARGKIALTVVLALANLVFILGTGQRSPFVRMAVVVVVTLYIAIPKKVKVYFPWIAAVSIPVFFLATFATGRAGEQLAAADGFGAKIGVFFEQLLFRIFNSSQTGAVVGFRWADGREIPLGSEWLQGLVGLLPGQTGPDTANQIYALQYGSTRGTTPLSLWGSAYYNFGFGGTIVVAVVVALVLCVISQSILKRETVNLIWASGAAGITMTLGLWISDGPTTPLNGGLGVYVLLWIWGSSVAKRGQVRGGVVGQGQ